MCGKFTTRQGWAAVTDPGGLDQAFPQGDDRVRLRVMDHVPVILFDHAAGRRRVVPMRWGFPDPADWRRPRPIHARGETVDTVPAFASAFQDGQRGIVLMEQFNEAPDLPGPVRQHVIMADAPLAAAMLWRRFMVEGNALFACVLVTVPANVLLTGLPTDRMPAFLAPQDWGVWLGDEVASPGAAKACLKTTEGPFWSMAPEPPAHGRRPAPPVTASLF